MLKEYQVFKAAAIQAASVYRDKPLFFDSRATLEKALHLIGEAAGNGARLVVFPETWLPGFPYWSLSMAKGPEWAEIWAEYLRHSIEVPGDEVDALCDAAKGGEICIAIGINERDRKYEGRMYNSVLFIDSRGEVMGTHRKICITINEQLYHTRGDGGENLRVFETDIGKVSGLICGEHYQPLLKHHLIMQGAQVNCSLWPGFKGGAGELMTLVPVMTQAACASGGFWAVLASAYIPPDQVPSEFYDNHVLDQTFGGSCIINPFGEIVSGPVIDEETIVYGDIDLKLNAMAKSIINLKGSYSRWDIMSLNVRETPYEPITYMGSTEYKDAEKSSAEVEKLKARIRELEKNLQAFEEGSIR
ncbi:nitrilase-related carbon-nitrogen hydrolase [Thermodesulfobacteriota bacterium]